MSSLKIFLIYLLEHTFLTLKETLVNEDHSPPANLVVVDITLLIIKIISIPAIYQLSKAKGQIR